MAGKNIQISLTFSSDTRAAKKDINALQQSLTNLATKPLAIGNTQQMQKELRAAQQDAIELKVALERATNVDTGKINFSKFQQELKANGKNLTDYVNDLKKIGPAGTEVFIQLGKAIREAETPIINLSAKAKKLVETFGNTLRWSLSSSALQGFTQMLSGTVDYAKELNKSLTDIRIVTGKSENEMSKFAASANKAAKSLAATTTEYTNASLIYYQQGLTDKEVAKRTATTLKLANVVGESAETVSNWMTAIWNNFDDGSKSLEYYGDVLATLGAKTASSADEIAQGLEKFSAISDTVGLSYEYAASALATVTAETRQSADVVGTAFKTIFSRMESLDLGETLDDGTTLGKYSAAMAKVGVEIKDANNQMRKMDDILADLGEQWRFLNKDQQIALAQSVAGIRQYNQFIGLMDNWNVMEENLKATKEATGALEYQQDIYASGMEGASKRVENALEKMKNTLLDEDDLIPLMNALEVIVNFGNDLIEAFGGLPGILTLASSILLKMFSGQAANFLRGMTSNVASLAHNISGKTSKDKKEASNLLDQSAAEIAEQTGGEENFHRAQFYREDIKLAEQLAGKETKISAAKDEQLNLMSQILDLRRKAVLEADKEYDVATNEADELERYITIASTEKLPKAQSSKESNNENTKDTKTSKGKVNETKDSDETRTCDSCGAELDREKQDTPDVNNNPKDQTTQPNTKAEVTTPSDALLESLAQSGMDSKDIEELRQAAGYKASVEDYANKLQGPIGVKGSHYYALGGQKHLDATQQIYDQVANTEGIDQNILEGMKTAKDTIFAEGADKKLKEKERRDIKKEINKKKKDPTANPEELKELEERYNDLTLKIKEHNKTIKAASKEFNEYSKEAKVLDKTVQKQKKTYTGLDKQIDKFAKSTEEANLAQVESNKNLAEAEEAHEQMADQQQKAIESSNDWAATLVNGAQIAAQATSGIMMMIGAVDSLSTALANDEATFGDWLGAITSVIFGLGQMVEPLSKVIGLFRTKKTVTEASTAEDLKAVAVNNVEIASEKAVGAVEDQEQAKDDIRTNKEVANNNKKIISNIGKWISKGPHGWIIAGIAAAALAAIGIAVAVNTSNKQNEKQAEEDYNAGTELANATIEEVEANKELMFDYADMYEQYKKTGEGKDELIKKANELAEAYHNESIAIAALNGDYDKMNSLIMESTSRTLDKQIDEFNEAEKLESASLQMKQEENNGKFVPFLSTLGKKGTIKLKAPESGPEVPVYEAIAELSGKLKYYDKNTHSITADPGNVEEFVDSYEELTELANKAKSKGATNESVLYKEWINYLSEHKDTYDQLSKQVETKRITQAQKKVVDARSAQGNAINSTQNMSEYLAMRQEILASSKGDDEEEERIKSALAEYGGVFEQKALKIEEFELNFGKNSDITKGLVERIKTANDTVMKAINAIDDVTILKIQKGILTWEEAVQRNLVKATKAARDEIFDELYENADVGEFYADTLALGNEQLRENGVALNNAAIAAAKLNSALEDTFEVWEKHAGTLVNGTKNTISYANAISNMANQLKEMFNLDKDLDFTVFTANNMNLLQDFFTTGSTEAFNELQKAIAEENAFRLGASWDAIDAINQLNNLNLKQGEQVDQETLGQVSAALAKGLPEAKREEILQKAGWDITGVDADGKITRLTRLVDDTIIDPQKLKELQKEFNELIDPLTEINLLLEAQEELLNRVSKSKDRAYGKTRLKYLAEETKEMKKLLSLENQKLNIMNQEFKNAQNNILSNYEGITINAQGQIQNRIALEQQYRDKWGNSETFKQFQKDLEKYDKALMNALNQESAIIELKYDIEDNELAEFLEPIELQIEFNDKDLERLEWLFSHLEDKEFAAAEKINILSEQAAIQMNNLAQAEKGLSATLQNTFTDSEIAEILSGNYDILNTKEITAEQADKLREFAESSMDYADALKEIKASVEESLIKDFEDFNSELEKNIELLNQANTTVEHYKNIIELVGKDNLGISNSMLKDLSETAVNVSNARLETAKTALETNKQAYLTAKEQYEQKIISKETFEAFEAQYNTSLEEFQSAWIDALTAVNEAFKQSVELALEDFNKAMGGVHGSLDEISNWYDKQREMSDFYLKDYEKIYEINKLNRKITDSIDLSDSAAAQSKLRNLQKELLGYQEEGKEMSDYDLGYLQKKYELMQAQIALEEARNNKSTVRLQRDSEGNFGYVYTADQQAVEQSEQKYEDALYNMEKYLDDSTDALTRKYLEYAKQWQEEIANLDETAEDYQEKAAAITEHYSKLCNMTVGEMSDMLTYGKSINEEYGTHIVDTFKQTLIGNMYDDVESFEELADKTNIEMKKSLDTISAEWDKYQVKIDTVMNLAGTSVTDFKDKVGEETKGIKDKIEEVKTKIGGLASDFETKFNNAITKVKNFATDFGLAIQPVIDKVSTLVANINYILQNYDAAITKGEGIDRGGSSILKGGLGAGLGTTGGLSADYSGGAINDPNFATVSNVKKAQSAFTFTNTHDNTTIKVAAGADVSYAKDEKKAGHYNVQLTGRDASGNEVTTYSNISATDLESMIGIFDGSPNAVKVQDKNTMYKHSYIQLNDGQWYSKGSVSEKDWKNLLDMAGKKDKSVIEKPKGLQPVPYDDLQKLYGRISTSNDLEIAKRKGIAEIPVIKGGEFSQSTQTFKGESKDYASELEGNDSPDIEKVLDLIYYPHNGTNYWARVQLGYWDGDFRKNTNDKDDGYWREGDKIWIPAYNIWDDDAKEGESNWVRLDTGGYTGSWGPEGRLAMLHQKEIVLNAHDTENFLTAIGIVRDISDQLERNALTMGRIQATANYNSNLRTTGDTLQQEVHITAEFPNATNHNEIEEAFRNLTNLASQYANRKF